MLFMRGTPATALAALASSAILTIVLIAQGIVACTKAVAVAMPDMPGMAMAAPGAVMICPVILMLAATSVGLTVSAAVRCAADPHRALAGRRIARLLARLPAAPAGLFLALGGAAGIGLMFAIDGNEPSTLGGWCALAAVVAGASLVLTLLSQLLGRIVLALGAGVAIVIAALFVARAYPRPGRSERLRAPRLLVPVAALLSAGRGLRAPPLSVR